ncbi:hypothetical protein BZY94_36220 [Burkholderia territorii]|nr:hypothetical protein BZY94_36220 [Burkholderia territorii]
MTREPAHAGFARYRKPQRRVARYRQASHRAAFFVLRRHHLMLHRSTPGRGHRCPVPGAAAPASNARLKRMLRLHMNHRPGRISFARYAAYPALFATFKRN